MPELAVLTPVRNGEAGGLRKLLRGLPCGADGEDPSASVLRSPFEGLSVTHFARLVVIDTGSPQLLFTSRFDGEERAYLSKFAASVSAREIYKRCKRPQRPHRDQLDEQRLFDYLLNFREDRLQPSYVVSAFPADASVARINAALELRATLSSFAVRQQDSPAVVLAHRFRQERLIRELAEA
jgi:hypothetical protein